MVVHTQDVDGVAVGPAELGSFRVGRERIGAGAWEREQDERLDRLVIGWTEQVDRRGRIRAAALVAARERRVAAAREHLARLALDVLLRPTTPDVDALLAPLDLAVDAYVDFVDGRFDRAAATLTAAVADNGRLALRHGLEIRRALQLHLSGNVVRALGAAGDVDGARALGRAVLATAGDAAAWPFADGPVDPWAAVPAVVRTMMREQLGTALGRLAADADVAVR